MMTSQDLAIQAHELLVKANPGAKPELRFTTPFQFLVAIILSAQTTDVAVNKATPGLFAEYPDAITLAAADPVDIELRIKTIGLYRTKAKAIVSAARAIMKDHKGKVPMKLEELIALPGVGRKTANVFLGGAYQINSGIAVDTHVKRVAYRLGLTIKKDPEKIEQDLLKLLPEKEWHRVNTVWVLHGRYVCMAKQPNCEGCVLREICPKVGL